MFAKKEESFKEKSYTRSAVWNLISALRIICTWNVWDIFTYPTKHSCIVFAINYVCTWVVFFEVGRLKGKGLFKLSKIYWSLSFNPLSNKLGFIWDIFWLCLTWPERLHSSITWMINALVYYKADQVTPYEVSLWNNCNYFGCRGCKMVGCIGSETLQAICAESVTIRLPLMGGHRHASAW